MHGRPVAHAAHTLPTLRAVLTASAHTMMTRSRLAL